MSMLVGSEQPTAFARLDLDRDNLVAALRTLEATGNDELVLRLASALRWYWLWRGMYGQGITAIDAALAREPIVDGALESSACATLGLLCMFCDQWPSGQAPAERGLDIARTLADDALASDCLWLLSGFSMHRGDSEDALRLADQAVASAQAVDDSHRIAVARFMRGVVRNHRADRRARVTTGTTRAAASATAATVPGTRTLLMHSECSTSERAILPRHTLGSNPHSTSRMRSTTDRSKRT